MENVNWELYKGKNGDKQREAYIKFYNNVLELGGEILTEYINTDSKVLISINNEVSFYISPHKFNDRTYLTANRFRENLSNNNEKFIKYTKYVENTGLTANIITVDGVEINISIGAYDSFCKSRNNTKLMAKEIGFKVKGYVSNSKNATFYNDYISFDNMPNRFKTQTYKSAINFINSLEDGDTFIDFIDIIDKKCLIAKIKNKFNTYQNVALSSYELFKSTRREFYKYCDNNNYKVISAYEGVYEDILIDIGCVHGEFKTTPKLLMKSKFKCPKCVTFKGENNPNWKPNLTQEDRENGRFIMGYKDFIKGVYARDKYICKCCGVKGNGHNLNAHHLNGYNWDKKNRMNIDNGVTLCEYCHKDFHNAYGKGDNTKEQFEEWNNKIKKKDLESAI